MLANVQKVEQGYIARFERHFPYTVEQVWAWLTDNEKLKRWFAELRVVELRKGGIITFDMGDGTFEELEITAYMEQAILEYTWGKDKVRFELSPLSEGCQLNLIEQITIMTDHTAKDLAGWHVCLDVIKLLLDGSTTLSREEEWKHWYAEYKMLIALYQ
ncbi:SRPBCC family protein [Paenibacillus sp. ACRRX]|uniref:SRPBCC family protein n=1 Tax=Paenibacillus sp. ACRRX TaxID=2918206 RepID=UPI001EF5B8DD|nr:SRPBCC family protein [Paenibacillus sp. ACRRX]MCG7406837.1 SRPBCC family protein [Paenibacillus sp. ACRRX]